MGRPSQRADKRRELIPLLARTFADLGYRRTTTALLAKQCGVQENILYRIWPNKKAMFIAALDYVYDLSLATWRRLTAETASTDAARAVLEYEATHHGEFGHYRIVFAGLSETDDPEIRAALVRLYRRYQRFIQTQIRATDGQHAAAASAAWMLIGVGTMANIGRELGLFSASQRRRLFADAGQLLLDAHD